MSECLCVCVAVSGREGESVCVCVCVCVAGGAAGAGTFPLERPPRSGPARIALRPDGSEGGEVGGAKIALPRTPEFVHKSTPPSFPFLPPGSFGPGLQSDMTMIDGLRHAKSAAMRSRQAGPDSSRQVQTDVRRKRFSQAHGNGSRQVKDLDGPSFASLPRAWGLVLRVQGLRFRACGLGFGG